VSGAAVSGGNFDLTVAIDGMSVYTTQGSACGHTDISLPMGMGSVGIDGLPCPVAKGTTVHVAASLTLPDAVPAGNYDVKVTATGDAGVQGEGNEHGGDSSSSSPAAADTDLFCLELQFSL
jgi:hypothetical protein